MLFLKFLLQNLISFQFKRTPFYFFASKPHFSFKFKRISSAGRSSGPAVGSIVSVFLFSEKIDFECKKKYRQTVGRDFTFGTLDLQETAPDG